MPADVEIYTSPPAALVKLLRSHHLPQALPLARRLSFTRFAGGMTEHTRILFAAAGGAALGSDTAADTAFAAAYLDYSRGPETELWLYATLERRPGEEASAACARRVLREVARQRALYSPARAAQSTVLAGTLSEALRLALLDRAVAFARVDVFDKWLFRLDDLPDVPSPLRADMRWEGVRRADIPLMLSRTSIQRTERTIVLLPSMAVYRDDDTPVSWALMGPDSSLSCLHCEEEWRGKGFAKAVAVKILRERLKDYDDDVRCWADVAPDNPKSQRVCRSLGGKVAWTISWSTIDLDKSFPDQ
ncbi:hypothetical protein F4804DRAFT_163215 [Jackrogersella minutella]|nr:hypothetical protein F4804DRAFT_163215 [Jackrogersella minutella]